MSTVVSVVTVVAAFISALLLVYASFDLPVHNTAAHTQVRREHMRSIRELGLWGAIVALIGAYLMAFLM
jgi:hypothetical protein